MELYFQSTPPPRPSPPYVITTCKWTISTVPVLVSLSISQHMCRLAEVRQIQTTKPTRGWPLRPMTHLMQANKTYPAVKCTFSWPHHHHIHLCLVVMPSQTFSSFFFFSLFECRRFRSRCVLWRRLLKY